MFVSLQGFADAIGDLIANVSYKQVMVDAVTTLISVSNLPIHVSYIHASWPAPIMESSKALLLPTCSYQWPAPMLELSKALLLPMCTFLRLPGPSLII